MNLYVQDSGRWYDGKGNLLGVGYAGGNKGMNPEGVNNPSLSSEANVGPLPSGLYKIGRPFNHDVCGKYFMPLSPNPDNQMFGRSGFGVHGDLIAAAGQQKASDGCVILALGVREQIGARLAVDDDLEVVATQMDPTGSNEVSGTKES